MAETKKPTMRVAASIPRGPIRLNTSLAARRTKYVTDIVATIAAEISANAATSNSDCFASEVMEGESLALGAGRGFHVTLPLSRFDFSVRRYHWLVQVASRRVGSAFVATLVMANNFAATPDGHALTLALAAASLAAGSAFFIRQRRACVPLYDLRVAARRIFWVAAAAGSIVFGTLMGAMFVGQQFLQNVLGYSTLDAGVAIFPGVILTVLTAPLSARLVSAQGARFTLLTGYAFCLLGFVTMLLLWREGAAYWKIGLGYAFIGIGVGFAGTPASHALTGSVPVDRAGMASGTADLAARLFSRSSAHY
jgi:hypothetical protein